MDWPVSCKKATKRDASGPKSPTPNRLGNDVGCSRMPLALAKFIGSRWLFHRQSTKHRQRDRALFQCLFVEFRKFEGCALLLAILFPRIQPTAPAHEIHRQLAG